MTRVLIVDDSRAFRAILKKVLTDAGFEICGEAGDPYEARDRIGLVRPDVVTLDINMPRMDGEEFLRHLMGVYPLPVVVISGDASRTTALRIAGAAAVVPKPVAGDREGFTHALIDAIRTAAAPRARHVPPDVIAIGASTGGAAATSTLLAGLPRASPPIVIAQHILPHVAGSYASWLGREAPMQVRECRDGEALEPGVAFLPPRDRHIRVVRNHDRLHVALSTADKVNGHRPSIDVLFSSLAVLERVRVAAVLLTGMGNDGAAGLLELRKRGARTFAQAPADCVLPAMPESAIRLGAAQTVLPAASLGSSIIGA